MEKRWLGGPAESASSRLVEHANIRAGLKRGYLLFGTISKFQAARMAVPSHRFRCRREIHVPPQWCCFACSSFGWCTGRSCFLPCLLLRGVAWPPSLGAVAFFPLLSNGAAFPSLFWVGFPFSSVGWCCLASSFFGSWCFGCCGVKWFGGSVVRCCVLGRVLGGWVWRWCLVVECWVGCWVAKRMRGVWGVQWCWGVLESMFSCLGSDDDENDTEE